MIRTCFRPPLLCAALLFTAGVAPGTVDAGGAGSRIGGCAIYGPGFIDMGNGICGRVAMSGPVTVDGRMRIDPGSRTLYYGQAWPANGTASAELRSDRLGMMPGISNARHLRIEGGTGSDGR